MPAPPRGALLVFALLALVALSGCGLFKPRSAEKPVAPSTPCLDLTNTENVKDNILAQYGQPDGSSCYASGIDPAFAFHPDPTDSVEALAGTPFGTWNYDIETRGESNLSAHADSVAVAFDSEYANPVKSQDSETWYWNYHVLFNPQGPAGTTRYQGQADITFRRNPGDGKWRIVDWADHRDGSGLPTWGSLRLNYKP